MVAGRESLTPHLPLYGRGTWIVRNVLVHPFFRRFLSHWKLWSAAIVLAAYAKKAAVARLSRLGKKDAAPARSGTASKGKSLEKLAAQSKKKASFYQLLAPEVGQRAPIVGFAEIGVLVVASLTNAWLMLYKAWLMREFVTGQNLGLWRRWLQALAKFPVATMLSAFLTQVTQYTQGRVSLLWRRSATLRLMREYFADLNYYKLLQHGTLRIDDPDVRMSSDIQAACDALTQVFMSGLSGFTMSIFSSWALYKRRGLYAVPLPYIYSLVMLPLTFSLAAPDWSVMGLVQKAKGAYQQCLTRCQLHSEGIAMLRGENFERSVLDEKASAWIKAECHSWVAMYRYEWVSHIFTNPSMPGIWQTVSSFGAAFLALRPSEGEALEALEPNEAVVYEYSENISDFWQVFYAVRGATMFLSSLDNYKRCSASIQRIEQLQSNLAELSNEANAAEATTFSNSPAISFEDVSVKTPKGEQLVAGLTFRVEPGQHLVICGHNGAGKSSIFRCLGGLWPVAAGAIACPRDGAGSGGLHGAAYYLPQRPANILGTLSDQLTYPTRADLSEAQMRCWLGYVKLEHLVDMALESPNGLSVELDWEIRLSLGEQQRLGIARVLYHRPQFAILDECTSAVAKETEKWLFEVAQELGISYVTITHRPALQEQHHQMLKLTGMLAQDGRGWRLDDLPSNLPPTKPLVTSEDDVHKRLRLLMQRSGSPNNSDRGSGSRSEQLQNVAARSKKHKDAADKQIDTPAMRAKRRWPTALQRIGAALRMDLIDTKTRMRFLLMIVCMLCRAQFTWEVYRTVAGSVTRTMCNDGPGLYAELLTNLLYASGLTTLDRFLDNLGRRLTVDVWKRLADVLHEQALQGGTFHRMQSEDQHKVENPIQRIAEVKELLADVKGQFTTTGGQVWQMIYSFPVLIRGGGIAPAITLIGLYIVHYIVRNRWMPNFKAITAKYTSYEANFQVAQTRLRHVAEPVAFSGGGEVERLRIEEHFKRLCEHRMSSLGQEFLYNFLTAFFIQYDSLPMWFHRLLSFNFAWRNVPIGGASPASAVQNYLYDRTISVNLAGVQSLAAFSAEWGRMDGRATRVLELYEALDELRKEPQASASIHSSRDTLAVKKLDLVTPKGECLAADLSFSVELGSPLLITGPNGSGKTSLARVLMGLWPCAGDGHEITIPRSFMMVTQKPYLAPGSLGDQVSYPDKFVLGKNDEDAAGALRATGIYYLFERNTELGWSYRCAWEEVLSGGEQQRMCLARAFFHRPRFAMLDECTSMVAADAEEGLYSTAIKEYGITPLTFSQRLFLSRLHSCELRLGDNSEAGWSMSNIAPAG